MAELISDPGEVSRRQMLCGIVALGLLSSGVLAGCGDSGGSGGDNQGAGDQTPTPGSPSVPTSPSASPTAAGGVLAPLTAVPVGSGIVVTGPGGRPMVLVQPSAGNVRAFSAVCTHQGTTIDPPQNGVMTCPNHGSQFAAADGSVRRGPAAQPLPQIAVRVQGPNIVLA